MGILFAFGELKWNFYVDNKTKYRKLLPENSENEKNNYKNSITLSLLCFFLACAEILENFVKESSIDIQYYL